MGNREWWTKVALVVLSVCNVIDALATHYLLSNGLGRELNPFIGWLYGLSPGLFLALKCGILLFLLLPLWMETHSSKVQYAIWGLTTGYLLLAMYYVVLLGFWS